MCAMLGSMLNLAIFDPWQRSLFSCQRSPGKGPLLAGKHYTVHVGDKNFVSLPEIQEKFRCSKFLFQNFLLNTVALGSDKSYL